MSSLHLCFAAVMALCSCTSTVSAPAEGQPTTASGIRRPTSCPRCQSRDVVTIVYGRLAPEGQQRVRDGLIVSGGCMVGRENPDWHCKGCGFDWYDANDPQRNAAWDAFEREMQQIYEQHDATQKPPRRSTRRAP
jgi:hypothetical protein